MLQIVVALSKIKSNVISKWNILYNLFSELAILEMT